MEKNKGITLIALVITIIVLLILAGVTIATLTGDNGLLQKSTSAKQENEEAKELELIKLAVSAAKISGEGTITTENLSNELKNNFSNNENILEISNYIYCKGYRIYKDGKVEKGNLLPDEYQQVKYIESSGTQWIDTGKYLGYKNSFVMRLNVSYWTRPTFGKNSNGRECFFSDYDVYLNGRGLMLNFLKNTWYDIIMDTTDGNANFYVNDELLLQSGGTNNHGKVYLFGGCNSYGSYDIDNFAKYKLERFSTYNNGELEQNLIPCYRQSDNEIGMYDLVNNTFYINQGTGTFGYETEDGIYVAPTNN